MPRRTVVVLLSAGLLAGCSSRGPVADEVATIIEPVLEAPIAPAPDVAPSTLPTPPAAAMTPTEEAAPATAMPSLPAVPASSTVGASRAGRSIDATTFGAGDRRVYLIGSIHGDESEGRSALDDIRVQLATIDSDLCVRLVDDMNPDGSADHTRTSSTGVDLNRNWPASNFKPARSRGKSPLSEPETAAIHADITAFDPHIIIVLHSARNGPFINYDGPSSAADLAVRFVAAAVDIGGDPRWRLVPDMGYPTPGSMGSYFGRERGVPILTVELRRGDTLENVRLPLIAGLAAVLSERSVALAPLSTATPTISTGLNPAADTEPVTLPAK